MIKPTKEQLREIERQLADPTPAPGSFTRAQYLWDVIAPMVLEEAARVCNQELRMYEAYDPDRRAMQACQTLSMRIRAMGKP